MPPREVSTPLSIRRLPNARDDLNDSAARRFLVRVQRVACFLPNLDGGGAERVMLNLARGFADRRLAVDLVLIDASGPLLALVPPGVRVIGLHTRRAMQSVPGLVRYLRSERPTALMSALNGANVAALWARAVARVATRVIVTQHICGALGSLMPYLFRIFYPWADEIVAVSQGVATGLAAVARVPLERIRVIYNPVVTPEVRQQALEPVVHPWLAVGAAPVVLGVGRLSMQKDFRTLLRAFALLRKARTARLIILGEGEERPHLQALARDLGVEGDVDFPGFVGNPYAFMARSAVLALSSTYEGLPTVLIEALALGTPVVSTDCPFGPREILRDGRLGTLVPVGDAASLAKGLIAAIEAPKIPVAAEAWEAFTLDAAVGNYLHLLGMNGHA